MIAVLSFQAVIADIRRGGRPVRLLNGADLDIPSGRYILVADREDDRSALVDFICGRRTPTGGRVVIRGEGSFPIGRVAPFGLPVRGTTLVSHLASIYDVPRRKAFTLFETLLSDPDLLDSRLDLWPPLLRLQFGMIAGLLRPFDLLLVDGPLAHAAMPAFAELWTPLFAERCRNATLIVSTRQTRLALDLVEKAIVLSEGGLHFASKEAALRPLQQVVTEPESETVDLLDNVDSLI